MLKKTIVLMTILFAVNQTFCESLLEEKLNKIEKSTQKDLSLVLKAQENIIKILSQKHIHSSTSQDIVAIVDCFYITEKK